MNTHIRITGNRQRIYNRDKLYQDILRKMMTPNIVLKKKKNVEIIDSVEKLNIEAKRLCGKSHNK
jgi:hypothetical protein